MTPLTVHLVGAQKANAPWGFECKVIETLKRMGIQVISTDFRLERAELAARLRQPVDLVLVCKGEWIPADLIAQVQTAPTVLWFAEFVGSERWTTDWATLKNRRMLAYNGSAFDYVFSHDQGSLSICAMLGCRRIGWLPTAVVDPVIHCKLQVPKTYDVLFIGGMTPRRRAILDRLAERFTLTVLEVRDPVRMNELFNRAKIVLNIHAGDVLNTETRLCEVLGTGTFLLSEEISSPDLLMGGEHLAYWPHGQLDVLMAQIDYYLQHDEERERMAAVGYDYVHANHTLQRRLTDLLVSLDLYTGSSSSRPDVQIYAADDIPPPPDSATREEQKQARRQEKLAVLWSVSERLRLRLRAKGLRRPRWFRRSRY